MRVVYLAGPGDIIRTYGYWKNGLNDPNEMNVTYSSQFFDVCSKLNADAYVISSNKRKDIFQSGRFKIEHRPNEASKQSGFKYHYGVFIYTIGIIITAIRYKADVMVVSAGVHWFFLAIMPLFGIKIIPTLHCTLYSKYKVPSNINKIINKLNSLFFYRCCFAIMSASFELTRQIKGMVGNKVPIIEFLPLYTKDVFFNIKKSQFDGKNLNIIYIGRIEYEKGVFDLLKMYKVLKKTGLILTFNICGSGALLADLRVKVADLGANENIIFHGHCNRDQLVSLISKSHIFVVPTRTDFLEGFNQVVVEAVLSGRPVITSDVCPALEHVNSAALQVRPDDVNDYAKKIQSLYGNKVLYESKIKACKHEQEKFYEKKSSWGNGLEYILTSIDDKSMKSYFLKRAN